MDICTMGHKMGEMCKKNKFAEKNLFMLSFFQKIFSISKGEDKEQDFFSAN